MIKFKIVNELRKLITANTGITSLIGSNFYPISAPEKATGNIIVYGRTKYEKDYSKFGVAQEKCEVAFYIISDNYDTTLDIAEKLNNLLEGPQTHTNTYKYYCRLVDSDEDMIDKKYIQTLIFEIV